MIILFAWKFLFCSSECQMISFPEFIFIYWSQKISSGQKAAITFPCQSDFAWLIDGVIQRHMWCMWTNSGWFAAWNVDNRCQCYWCQWTRFPDCQWSLSRRHCWASIAFRLAFIFSTLLDRWQLLASNSSIRSRADLSWKMEESKIWEQKFDISRY